MQRRTIIAAIGSTFLAGAGCISNSDAETEDPSNTDADDGSPSNPDTDDGTPAETDPGQGDAVGASFEDIACPSFVDDPDRTVCSHTTAPGETRVYPTVSRDVFTPTTGDDTVETMEVSVHNESEERFGFNPHSWEIHRRSDGGWTHIAPDEYVEPWYNLKAGETYSWVLGVESGNSPEGERKLSLTQDLDSGTYAFQITGFLQDSTGEETPNSDTEGTLIECIALFKVNRT